MVSTWMSDRLGNILEFIRKRSVNFIIDVERYFTEIAFEEKYRVLWSNVRFCSQHIVTYGEKCRRIDLECKLFNGMCG